MVTSSLPVIVPKRHQLVQKLIFLDWPDFIDRTQKLSRMESKSVDSRTGEKLLRGTEIHRGSDEERRTE